MAVAPEELLLVQSFSDVARVHALATHRRAQFILSRAEGLRANGARM